MLRTDSRTLSQKLRTMLDCELQSMLYQPRVFDAAQRKAAARVLNARGSRKANGSKWTA